jgi:hypothetical protein
LSCGFTRSIRSIAVSTSSTGVTSPARTSSACPSPSTSASSSLNSITPVVIDPSFAGSFAAEMRRQQGKFERPNGLRHPATRWPVLGERAAAHDAVHDTFLVAMRRLDEPRDPAATTGWLHAIIRNSCLTQMWRASRELSYEDREHAGGVAESEEALERPALGNWV